MAWYYVENEQPTGPLTEEEIGFNYRAGRFDADTLLWREGMTEWLPIKALFQLPPVAPRPAATPPAMPAPDLRPEAYLPPVGSVAFVGQTNPRAPLQFTFTGSWLGYYRVWIVGLLFTVLTLGLYAPWAKVRNRRYLYGHTRLGDDAFDYRAAPRRMLFGQLLVAGLVAFWLASPLIHPWLPLALIGVGVLFLPWIVAQSLRFNARATAWRGLRFGFKGGSLGCFYVFAFLPAVCLGVFWPAAARARRRWLVERHHFGAAPFSYQSSLPELYGIYLKGLAFFVPAGLCYIGVMLRSYVITASEYSADGSVHLPLPYWIINLIHIGPALLPFMLPVALGGVDFLKARLFTHHWNGTTLGPHAVQAYMEPWEVFKLRLIHTVAMICSLGLLWPWVKIRTHTFKLSCLDLAIATDLGDLAAAPGTSRENGALGESATDFFDLDIGL